MVEAVPQAYKLMGRSCNPEEYPDEEIAGGLVVTRMGKAKGEQAAE